MHYVEFPNSWVIVVVGDGGGGLCNVIGLDPRSGPGGAWPLVMSVVRQRQEPACVMGCPAN